MKKTLTNLRFLWFIFFIVVSACSIKRQALGAENELVVLATIGDRPALREILEQVFNDTIYTPQPEPAWIIKFADPEGFIDLKRQTLLVIGSLGDNTLNPGTHLTKTLLGPERYQRTLDTDEHVIFTRDQFAKDQLFLMLSARDKASLYDAVMKKRSWIRAHYEELYNLRQGKYLFTSHRQKKLEQSLREQYGWQVKIPWGWELIHDSTAVNLVWLGREMPYQWFSVQWQSGLIAPDDSTARAITRAFPKQYYGSIRYTDFHWVTRQVNFRNWTAWKTTGVWESIDEPQGGPFLHYLFYDGVTNRTYQISCIVYDPGSEKAIRLRQLDLIAHTFDVFEDNDR